MGEKVFRRKSKPKKYHFILSIYSMNTRVWSCTTGVLETTTRDRNKLYLEVFTDACEKGNYDADDNSILVRYWSLEPNEL